MPVAVWIVLFVIAQRVGELLISRRNSARLLAEGAVEVGRDHYPVMVMLHGAWCAALLWWAWSGPAVNWALVGVFAILQLARVWVLATLGPYWTTRIITRPDMPVVRRGPYRFLRHPNYVIVALEIPVLPLALGAPWMAVGFGLANLAMLAWRIRVEEAALTPRRGL